MIFTPSLPVRAWPLLMFFVMEVAAKSKPGTRELEARLASIDTELNELASYSLRGGTGNVGYRSKAHPTRSATEWVEVRLAETAGIDEIVLVPAIWRDTKSGFNADGFPLEFCIRAGGEGDPEGVVVAAYDESSGLLPRVAPVVIPCAGVKASWVRLEATLLSPRAWDGMHLLQLSEMLVFDGEENVALNQSVTCSTPERFHGSGRHRDYLVDGFLPYLMDAAQGDQSVAFVSEVGIGNQPSLSVDLGESFVINRIHLHAVDISDTVPQANFTDFGLPRHFVVEASMDPDFAKATELFEYRMESIYDVGPILMSRFAPTRCRHLRVVAMEPFMGVRPDESVGSQIGFADFEVFAEGRNVALGKPIDASFGLLSPDRSMEALTDGRNLYGNLLPTRRWMRELARRHELETERPRILAALDLLHAAQKQNLRVVSWLAAMLAGGLVVSVLAGRIVRLRQITRVRERLAADLHDELGANFHAIGLLSDLALGTSSDSGEWKTIHRRIRALTERSGIAVRHCADMLEARGSQIDLIEDMRRAARRIMAKLDHDFSIVGERFLADLPPRTRVDLYLFYKECLVNISRHAQATRFETLLRASEREVELTVGDNGRGIDDDSVPSIPASLRRRARLLRGKVEVSTAEGSGTRVHLILRRSRWRSHSGNPSTLQVE